VIGLGEIGTALFSLLKEAKENFDVYGLDLEKTKMHIMHQDERKLPHKLDTIHVCLPCNNQDAFIDTIHSYAKRFKPNLVIINSTVPPGTTMKVKQRCNCLVSHSPVRGVHKNPEHMKWEIRRWKKYVGGTDTDSGNDTRRHFEKMNLKVKVLKTCTETELAKLFETTYRAWMIACFQEMHRISRTFDADFESIVDFLEDTHRIRLDRPIMFPGVIGGHCLIPNIELLLSTYDSEFSRLVLKSNEKRKQEVEEIAVQEEAEKIRRRAEALDTELIGKMTKNS
jgi:UDP-N-acetyl-D-mannosaminuronate dehydrogenase